MIQKSNTFNIIFGVILFAMFVGLTLVGGIFALIVQLIGGPFWLLIAVWVLPPACGTLLFLIVGRRFAKFIQP